jgi:hypothetical protein
MGSRYERHRASHFPHEADAGQGPSNQLPHSAWSRAGQKAEVVANREKIIHAVSHRKIDGLLFNGVQ